MYVIRRGPLLIGHVYKQNEMYFEYLGGDAFLVYYENFNPKNDLIILRGCLLAYAVEIPKDDKDFLKMKEEVINKINTYKNSPEFQELMNKFLTNQSDIDIILNSYDSSSTT